MIQRPIGYFVHHQGRGHAQRCAALIHALPASRPVTVFCAQPDCLPPLPEHVEVVQLPSLFEASGDEATALASVAEPSTTHCAPLGWPGIRRAMAVLANWFERADPAVIVSDVSAEVAQLARLCSVPHVCILQHGRRNDPGHRAAFDGALGVLAPFDVALMQSDWPPSLREKTAFVGGLGLCSRSRSLITASDDERAQARRDARSRLGIDGETRLHVVVSGGGGEGFTSAALGVAARCMPAVRWLTIGHVRRAWHATEPGNLSHHDWVDDATDHLLAADLIVGTAGNTLCQQVLAIGRPWIVAPEWCYFDEQSCKAQALHEAGLAYRVPHLPSHANGWRDAVDAAMALHDSQRQRRCVVHDASRVAAHWLDSLCARAWGETQQDRLDAPVAAAASVLTLARGRQAHLQQLIIGLSCQTVPPVELLIGVMQDEPYDDLPDVPFPVRQIPVLGCELPLARARNTVARAASSDVLIFLDVDCIAAPTLVEDYVDGLARVGASSPHAILMGEVRYLPALANPASSPEELDAVGVVHDHRHEPTEPLEACTDYRCFWSLNFALLRSTYERIGGFDEGFTGYGGEDTDFSKSAIECGATLHWLRGARAWHQHHDQRMPPVQHVEAVVRNAERFECKWGYRTMDHWLHAFALLGLIEEGADGLRLTGREPDAAVLASLHEPDRPYASTERAIEQLEQHVREHVVRVSGVSRDAVQFDRKRFVHRPRSPQPSRRPAERPLPSPALE